MSNLLEHPERLTICFVINVTNIWNYFWKQGNVKCIWIHKCLFSRSDSKSGRNE